jgi:hypothetical protein
VAKWIRGFRGGVINGGGECGSCLACGRGDFARTLAE